ncbi:MAG TPA: MraY family glycosyltransferase [Candidatus Limnocylindrales bacterium]|jgi:UDP-GlcNAc:undecaprenyl-phosphate GlcNAc-1-phosphate transferase
MNLSDDALQALPGLLLGFALAALVTLIATPFVRRYALRLGVVDRPEARRVNTQVVARGGGLAIGFGFVSVSLIMLALNAIGGLHFVDEPAVVQTPQVVALLGGAALAVAIGFLDDRFQLRARWQFVGQFALAGVAVALGVLVTTVNVPFASNGIPIAGAIAIVGTLVWIVGMINSINFIDGLDGLSSGIALIAVVTLGIISMVGVGTSEPEPYVGLFCFVLAGALAGFLRWNFHPASIFPGTSGILLVGYSLAVLSVLGAAKVAVALLVLGVPIIDAFWIIVRRLAARRSPFAPDRGHIHHRLLDLGLSHRASVLVIYGVCVMLALLSLRLSGTGQIYAFMGLVMVFGVALLLIERLSDTGAEKAPDPPEPGRKQATDQPLEAEADEPIEPATEAVGARDR